MNTLGGKVVITMTEKFRQKSYQDEEPSDWWGDFLKELKFKYGKDKSKRKNGADNKDAPTYKVDL